MITKIYVMFVFLIAFSSELNAQSLMSSLTCEIKKQVILEMKEGVPQVYSRYKDELKDGDKLNINFQASDSFINISLKNVERNSVLYLTDRHSLEKNLLFSNIDAGLSKMISLTSEVIHGIDDSTRLTLTKSYLSISTSFTNFVLERYHKDDWSGVINHPDRTHLIGIACTMDGAFNEIVERVRAACFSQKKCKNDYEKFSDINL